MAAQFGASSSSSSSAPIQPWTYHVFLSFRGEDTRNTFTGHLYSNLVQKGINTFIDDGLKRGEEISSSLLKAIEESKISVIVFSENYASSKWCLEELVKIMQCNESKKQIVYPVFYKVDPSHVRNQTGSFGQALAHHDDLKKVARWKTALTKAGNLSGRHFSHGGHESEFIRKIVEEISQQVSNLTNLYKDKYLVGIESRLENMEKLLCVGESGVRMVGVWGIGGLGKTTVAKAVYNKIVHKFEGRCFMENVRERSLKYGGLQKLQKFLLSKTVDLKDLEVNSLDEGSGRIKERLSHKRVLIILDDVNDLDQLKSLVGKPDWFGSGSRIIITTRDQDLLRRHDVDQIYQVEKFSDREALELFKINAFKENEHMSDYIEHIDSVIRYAEGLPLVLEVLGSHLRGISIDTWKDTLEYYKKNPKLQQFLKLSYDALEPLVKEVFLHIACFFKGENRNYVMTILEGCELPKHGIEVLIEKALIRITKANGIWMHDLLEEMGKEIVCQESPEPGERSRLWLYKDVYHAFVQKTGTSRVKGIMVKEGIPDQQITLNRESFIKLNNLQILIISDDIFYGDHVKYLPNNLSLLHWEDCPLQYFPSNFYPEKLVVLKMRFGKALSSWGILKGGFQRKMPWICTSPVGKRLQIMPNLKSLVLQDCHAVTTFSDFPTFPNLEELKIRDTVFQKFEIVEEMKSLKRLDLSWTSIRELPSSAIRYLTNLEQLTLKACEKLKHVACNIFELQHLQLLDLSFCDKLVIFPTKSEFSTESATLQDKHYAPLFVDLMCCWNLVEIGEFPREIYGLDATRCQKLKRISKLSNMLEGKDTRMIPRMNLSHCSAMYRNKRDSEAWGTVKNLPYNYSLFFSCRQSEYQVVFNYDYVPEWFTCRMDVTNVGLQVCNFRIDFPGNFKWEDKGLAFCVPNCYWGTHFSVLRIYINDVSIVDASEKKHEFTFGLGGGFVWTVWLYYMPFDAIIKRLRESGLPPPSNCLVKFEFQIESIDFEVDRGRSCGVHVVMPEDEGPFVHQLLDNGD
ncbi:PREDICTED: TMV resistance protein N-like [Fragaria vesca subsp. vesca]|uniref:TMV resistance protein N-like n=1 Tax=Fragaria vesca subsp. vesca TaxID=101020 RepID=UPI0002C350CE|nr:PREDICTED: TMV resistance protein N-like [Fragaria vesca subsp. vesca]XP_011461831.1 PREDICTED: TMV resistance protein N-like [Fragaria vesca subsp. vesca]XP_011461832.1 PREDICTED: TMV resistance protein N-like [Fragaria vesca subsp. vesca]XP_011461833.1 PREDICTED: TMV resistance protein N-like [Fragaria vesca subsp. vesca]XP_011461834.1 PREDICTED: TMV resistance protein N-like [Fragaria vesca subsp. vesca]XP_011461835.1 PREDICTED: TMV resistance protein N-like [Fragaria vesca subsp. vesca]